MRVFDPTGTPHDRQPVDARECVDTLGWSYTQPVPDRAGAVSPSATTMEAAPAGGDQTSSLDAPAIVPAPSGELLTIKDLRSRLKAAGVVFPSNAPKADLVTLYDGMRNG